MLQLFSPLELFSSLGWLDRVLMTFNFSTFQPLLYTQGDLDEVIKAREDEWVQRQVELERKVKLRHTTSIAKTNIFSYNRSLRGLKPHFSLCELL